MKKILAIAVFMFVLPCLCMAAKLTVIVPSGVREVQILSPGTETVLTYLHSQMKKEIQSFDEIYRVGALTKESAAANKISNEKLQAYHESSKMIRKEYIDKLTITVKNVEANISSESSLGEVNFTYTATNNSDHVIANVTYVPSIGEIKVPVATMLLLEFIDPNTLKFGLAPGRSLSNKIENPERISFLTSELSKEDLAYIKANIRKSFTLTAQDIHFLRHVDYKDQSNILTAEQAFAARLGKYRKASDEAQHEAKAKAKELTAARAAYEKSSEETKKKFVTAAQQLKNSSVRFTEEVDDDTCKFKDIPPGTYIIYASDGTRGVMKDITISGSSEKIELPQLDKDPFLP